MIYLSTIPMICLQNSRAKKYLDNFKNEKYEYWNLGILPGDICFNTATAPKVNFVFSLKNGKDAILFFKKNTQIPAVAHQAGLASENVEMSDQVKTNPKKWIKTIYYIVAEKDIRKIMIYFD